MSHSVAIQTQLTNVQALVDAFVGLGWNIEQNTQTGTFGSSKVYQLVARQNSQPSYTDIGIEIDANGFIQLHGDNDIYNSRYRENPLGLNFAKLKQDYAYHVARQFAAQNGGYISQPIVNEQGSLVVEIELHGN